MNAPAAPVVKDLVLIGGGHTHVAVLKRFGMRPVPGVRITVIARDVHTPYSGMLPGFVAGHYTFDEVHIDLARLARFAGARLYHQPAVGLDLDRREVNCEGRPPVPYDVLSINVGSTPAFHGVPGAAAVVVPVKPISRFVERWRRLRARVLSAEAPVRIGVVGRGPGGSSCCSRCSTPCGRRWARTGAHCSPRCTCSGRTRRFCPPAAAACGGGSSECCGRAACACTSDGR